MNLPELPRLVGNAEPEQDLLYHALNYRCSATPQAEEMWVELEKYVRAYAIAYGRAVQQACARVAEDERVDAAATGDATDAAYNIACEQIAAAIRNGVIREGEGE